MLNIKRLLELNAELRELNEEGLIDAGSNGSAKMHFVKYAFDELTKDMSVKEEYYVDGYVKLSVEIDGIEFFCLEETGWRKK